MSKHEIGYRDPDGELIGSGTIELLPGFLCSVGWSHSAFIRWDYRGQGYGSKAHAARLVKAKQLGFKSLLCSVRSGRIFVLGLEA